MEYPNPYAREDHVYPQTECTPDHGPRPAGRPDYCFFCGVKVGTLHVVMCAMNIVYVDVPLVLIVEPDDGQEPEGHTFEGRVPQDWSRDEIMWRFNESTWCTSNVIDVCRCRDPKIKVEHV